MVLLHSALHLESDKCVAGWGPHVVASRMPWRRACQPLLRTNACASLPASEPLPAASGLTPMHPHRPPPRRERFELALAAGSNEADGEAAGGGGERYRFSRCRRPLPAALMAKLGVPLPEAERQVLHDGLAWEEIQWGPSGVSLRGQLHPLVRCHFMPQAVQPAGDAAAPAAAK